MLIRIVKMSFKPEQAAHFLQLFNQRRHLIAGFAGCRGVELLRDIDNPDIFFTYSRWDNETHLNLYRESDLFKEVWSTVKPWFNDKPQAWSVNQL